MLVEGKNILNFNYHTKWLAISSPFKEENIIYIKITIFFAKIQNI